MRAARRTPAPRSAAAAASRARRRLAPIRHPSCQTRGPSVGAPRGSPRRGGGSGPARSDGFVSHTHDDNGDQIQAGARAFAYDGAGRLIETSEGGSSTRYEYDGDGTRVGALSGEDETRFAWDENGPLPTLALEHDGTGQVTRRYRHGLGPLSVETPVGGLSLLHADALGSITETSAADGTPGRAYAYEPFGALRAEAELTPGAPQSPLRFAGERPDEESGLYHLRARQYDPVAGRFLATDPLAPPLGAPHVSPYLYVEQRPTLLVDPSGLCSVAPWSRDNCVYRGAVAAKDATRGAATATYRAVTARQSQDGWHRRVLATIDALNPVVPVVQNCLGLREDVHYGGRQASAAATQGASPAGCAEAGIEVASYMPVVGPGARAIGVGAKGVGAARGAAAMKGARGGVGPVRLGQRARKRFGGAYNIGPKGPIKINGRGRFRMG